MSFDNRILNDLKESHIDLKVIIAFIPIAFITYLFHESGHWLFGELKGNKMAISLNNSAPVNGHFLNDSDALWSAIWGPLFTVLQGLVFLMLTHFTKSFYAYSVAFFAVFSRFFEVILGGLDRQDEARIAFLLGINTYLVAAAVLTVLFLILWSCNRIIKLNLKATGYFVVLGVLAILMVIGVNGLLLSK